MAIFQDAGESQHNDNHTQSPQRSRAKAVLRYAMMPDILPRIRALGLHFGHFAYLLALVFSSARLIPATHPALNAANIGRFGVRDVVAMAANNLTWSRNNIDQIAIFCAIVIGLIMVVIQAVLIVIAAVIGVNPASAAPIVSFFTTPAANVQTDVALIFLDQVFGPNLNVFGAATQPLGTSVHLGLQSTLSIYSMATMVIATIIVLYYIMTVVGEAAKTGTPFGQRFNSLWAPIRLVVALGLLVPLGTGLNSAQYITLWVAKMGSGLGTTIWTQFVQGVTNGQNLVAKPASQSTTELVKRVFLSEVCAASYDQIEGGASSISILQVTGNTTITPTFNNPQAMIDAAVAANMNAVMLSWSNKTAGQRETDGACGFINIDLSDFDLYTNVGYTGGNTVISSTPNTGFWNWVFGGPTAGQVLGSINSAIKAEYIKQIDYISQTLKPEAQKVAEYKISINATGNYGQPAVLAGIAATLQTVATNVFNAVNLSITQSYNQLVGTTLSQSSIVNNMVQQGWAAAGMWYGNLGKLNQTYMEAVNSAAPTLGTIVDASDVTDNDRGFFAWAFGVSRYNMNRNATYEIEQAIKYADTNYNNSIYSASIPANTPLYREAQLTGSQYSEPTSVFASGLLWLLGGSQLYDLQNNPTLDPMARLMGAGSTIVGRAIAAFTAGSVFSIAGAAASLAPNPLAQALGSIASGIGAFLFAFVMVGLVAGIFLFYVLPIIPFVYFTFAVIGWVLEIFEAVIAMPLWALAHLQIAGDGMPGPTALAGYHLLLMILLRPALIVFGLVGGYTIFGAAIYYFSTLFNTGTSILHQDIAQNDLGAFGVFVYTLIFTFLVYNIALMCFKMIDDVPKGILRWMGSGAQTFNDSRGDSIGGITGVVAGAAAGGQQIIGGFRRGATGVGNGLSGLWGMRGGPGGAAPTGGPTGPGPSGPSGGGGAGYIPTSRQLGSGGVGPSASGGSAGSGGGPSGPSVPPSRQLGSGGTSASGGNPHTPGSALWRLYEGMHDRSRTQNERDNFRSQYEKRTNK